MIGGHKSGNDIWIEPTLLPTPAPNCYSVSQIIDWSYFVLEKIWWYCQFGWWKNESISEMTPKSQFEGKSLASVESRQTSAAAQFYERKNNTQKSSERGWLGRDILYTDMPKVFWD